MEIGRKLSKCQGSARGLGANIAKILTVSHSIHYLVHAQSMGQKRSRSDRWRIEEKEEAVGNIIY